MPTHYQGTEKETRTLNTFIKLMRSTESLNNRLLRHLSENDLTVSQFGVLEALLHVGPQNQKELGARLLKSGGNITMVIDNLEKSGWVERKKNPKDRRAMIISLTKNGKSFIEDFFPKHLERIVGEFEVLTPEELEELGRLAKKVGVQTK
ncbi:MAG: MarR family transcriptional regulator [Balneolaceae bacterium]|nr:MarR family transcriptional regulator [Balneolaceae bacterium]